MEDNHIMPIQIDEHTIDNKFAPELTLPQELVQDLPKNFQFANNFCSNTGNCKFIFLPAMLLIYK